MLYIEIGFHTAESLCGSLENKIREYRMKRKQLILCVATCVLAGTSVFVQAQAPRFQTNNIQTGSAANTADECKGACITGTAKEAFSAMRGTDSIGGDS